MPNLPEAIPLHPDCPLGCTEGCKAADHIRSVLDDETVNDLRPDLLQILRGCGHLSDKTSPHHAVVAALMNKAGQLQQDSSSFDFLTNLGLNPDDAKRIADDDEFV